MGNLLVDSEVLHFRLQGNWTLISYDWNEKETNPVVDPKYKIVLG